MTVRNACKKVSLVTVSIMMSCSSVKKILYKDTVERKYRTSEKSVLNYDDTAKKYSADIIASHFNIHITIDGPAIIESASMHPDTIQRISGIEGTAIFRVRIDPSGKMKSRALIKSAGLGLDRTAEKILGTMKLKPVFWQGGVYPAEIKIRITFTSVETI